MKKFLKDHGYDTLLALLGILFGGSIVGLFHDVLAAFGAYPVAICACCGLSAILALWVSSLADRKAVKIAQIESAERIEMRLKDAEVSQAESKAQAERERRAKEKLEEMRFAQIAEKVRKANGDAKPAIVFLYDHGPVRNAFFEDPRPASTLERDMFDYEDLPGNVALDDLKPDVRKAIDKHPEVLEETRKMLTANPSLQWRYSTVGDPDPISNP